MDDAVRTRALAALAAVAAASCTTVTRPSLSPAADAATIGAELSLTYRVTANRGDGGCRLGDGGATTAPGQACYEAQIELSSARPLALAGRTLWFSQVDPVLLSPSAPARVEHVNGDLHALRLGADFAPLAPGQVRVVPMVVAGLVLTRAKVMPNAYVEDTAGRLAVIDSTREASAEYSGRKALPHLAPLPADLRLSSSDATPLETPELLFAENAAPAVDESELDGGIIPRPSEVTPDLQKRRFSLLSGFRLRLAGVDQAALTPALERLASLGFDSRANGALLTVEVSPSAAIPTEGYRLDIAPDAITVRASDSGGAFYALQSVAALIRPGQDDIPALAIKDAPRFGFRGQHLDIARNFHSPATIRALIDQMAAYKLNTLHLHIADDEGWRLEIPGLPELTEIGSRRCHDLSETRCLLPQLGSGPFADTSGSGHLTVEDYRDLLRYAQARHIEIIPSLDMPGHARAAVKAMEARARRLKAEGRPAEEAERYLLSDPADTTRYRSIQHYSDNTINVCRESSYRFVGHVLDELERMHREAGVPLRRYHIGADETAGAWKDSPLCRALVGVRPDIGGTDRLGAYFVGRVARMAEAHGVIPAAWSDGLEHAATTGLPARLQSNIWGTLAGGGALTAHDHANRGWDAVISIPDALYFDMPYSAHPDEGGYYWAARRAPLGKVFSMMPENLPALAGYWKDSRERPLVIDDRPRDGHRPLAPSRRFTGMQGHLWSETVRDPATLGYQLFPRMLALAERAWHRAAWEIPYDQAGALVTFGDPAMDPARRSEMASDWQRFAAIVGAKEMPKLAGAGWTVRIPPPGLRRENDLVRINRAFKELTVECLRDGEWVGIERCQGREGEMKLRTSAAAGKLTSRPITIQVRRSDRLIMASR